MAYFTSPTPLQTIAIPADTTTYIHDGDGNILIQDDRAFLVQGDV